MKEPIKVWGLATRVFHWSLVVCFCIAYLSGDEESLLHVYSSYVIIGLLGFRIIQGIVGGQYARFNQFVCGIKPTISYVQSILSGHPKHYLGHNPLGGWMVIALLVFLSLTSWTGLELYALEGKGPLASLHITLIDDAHANGKDHDDDRHDRENEQGEEWLEDLHEGLAEFTLFLVFLHIGGVLFSSLVHRDNLVKAMWTGYKTPQKKGES